jgi:hypothetical protein
MTLRDHTRIFFEVNYGGTSLGRLYDEKIAADIANDEVCRFVQDLRNYMLHRGFPQPQRHMSWHHEHGIATGVQFRKNELEGWSRWSSSAKSFLDKQGEFLEIPETVAAYAEKISALHGWIDVRLREHHQAELEELSALQSEFKKELKDKLPADYERLMTIYPDFDLP